MARRLYFHIVLTRCFVYRREDYAFWVLISITSFQGIICFLMVFSNNGNGGQRRRVNDYRVYYFIGTRAGVTVFVVTRVGFFNGYCHTSLLYQGIFKRFRAWNIGMLDISLYVSTFLWLLFGGCDGTICA